MNSTTATSSGMAPVERRAAIGLAGIYSLRMLGLFMILPVFSLYAQAYRGATPVLIGLAIGAYGMTQALLQIPFGLLSDRLGRKPVIVAGLLLFALGSVVAALADSIYGVIAGRALQGAGAIAAAVMALAADLTREEQRTKAMAIIGMSIGVSFSVAMVAGPVFGHWIGIAGIFWLTAVLALLGIAIVMLLVPQPVVTRVHRDAEPIPQQFGTVLRDAQLLRLDFGILTLHMIMTAMFVALPLVLRDQVGLAPEHHWALYLPVLALSVVAMVPFIILAERKLRMKAVFLGSVVALVCAELGLAEWHGSLAAIAWWLFVFYVGFNVLEATLPSLISRLAPPAFKGTALGFYSSSQFLGAFLGGTAGGWLLGHGGAGAVFLFGAGACAVWLAVAAGMRDPRGLSSRLVQVGPMDGTGARELAQRLLGVQGVAEAVVIAEDGVAYLKVDSARIDEAALEAVLGEQ